MDESSVEAIRYVWDKDSGNFIYFLQASQICTNTYNLVYNPLTEYLEVRYASHRKF